MHENSAYFNLPEHIIPINRICIGWPDEEKPIPARMVPEKLHYNGW